MSIRFCISQSQPFPRFSSPLTPFHSCDGRGEGKWREWEEFSGMKIDAEIRKWWWIFSKRQINESSSKVFGRKQKQTETTLTECEMSCGLLSFLHPSSVSHFPSLLMRNVVDTLWKGAKMAFKYFTFKVDDGESEEKSRNYCHFSLCSQGRWSRNEETFT